MTAVQAVEITIKLLRMMEGSFMVWVLSRDASALSTTARAWAWDVFLVNQ